MAPVLPPVSFRFRYHLMPPNHCSKAGTLAAGMRVAEGIARGMRAQRIAFSEKNRFRVARLV
jgi:hypothetical protein